MIHFPNTSFANTAVVGAFGLDAAALGALGLVFIILCLAECVTAFATTGFLGGTLPLWVFGLRFVSTVGSTFQQEVQTQPDFTGRKRQS